MFMKAKQVYLTGNERIAIQTFIAMELQFNANCEKMSIEPAFDTELLKTLFKKLAGHDWQEN